MLKSGIFYSEHSRTGKKSEMKTSHMREKQNGKDLRVGKAKMRTFTLLVY